ncbi:dihydropteroate synthase [Elusimicrobium posterum]|uniref:dihydropteroate synthase n=1 Tax=Elusimicrobium posterum TaxID=3116653 RepID=UPI003C73C15C
MGILNATPDSFYDGGAYDDLFTRAQKMIEEGADIIDIGGESTRPGAAVVELEEEAARVIPLLKEIKISYPAVKISVDTYKPQLAQMAAENGADILNDPSGLADEQMAAVAAKYNKKIVLMHTKGTPQNMNSLAVYDDMLKEMSDFFEEKIKIITDHGVKVEDIILDPGFGFAKNKEQNLFLLKNLSYFKKFGLEFLVALSRKRFLSAYEGQGPEDRLQATLQANLSAVKQGADILRVHDVAETVKFLS